MQHAWLVAMAVFGIGCSAVGDIGTRGEGVPAASDDGGVTTAGGDDASTTGDDGGAPTVTSHDAGGGTTTKPPTRDSGVTTHPQPDAAPTTTPPPPADAGPTDPIAAARALCVKTINEYRATLSLPPYSEYNGEETCVDSQAAADGAAGTAHSAFGKCSEMAQNECPGWPGPLDSLISGCFKMMWAEGPGTPFEAHGHYINMSSTSYTRVACGFHQMPDGTYWATQDFYP